MRVGYLVRRFPVRSQTFVTLEALDHAHAGLDVRVVSIEGQAEAETPLEGETAILRDRVTYLGVPRRRKDAARAFAAALPSEIAAGVPALRIALGQKPRVAAEALTLFHLARAWRRLGLDFDVLHCHFGEQGRLAVALKAAGLFTGRLATTFHGRDLSAPRDADWRARYRQLFALGDLQLPISDHWARALQTHGCPPDRIAVQRMGVDVAALAARAGAAAPRSGFALSSVGRFVEKKGHIYVVRALAALRQRRPDLNLTLDFAGDGPLQDIVRQEATALGLSDAVRFHGAVSHDRALSLMADSDAFVLPSVTAADGDMEGVPVVLMEAMAMGLPVAATRHSGIPELVDDGRNGLLADERDVEGLAGVLERLADDADLRARLGAAGRQTVETTFNRPRLGEALRARYRALASEGPCGSS